MSVFGDKKFEQLDWVTQVTETIESKLNELLARFPNETNIDFNMIVELISDSSYSTALNISVGMVVHKLLSTVVAGHLSYEDERVLDSCFKLVTSEDVELDFVNKELRGSICLVKAIQTLDDDKLQSMMTSKAADTFQRSAYIFGKDHMPRMNEILDILGGDHLAEDLASKSFRKKRIAIRNRLTQIFKTNEWRVRDVELAGKVGMWAGEYIRNGNLAALTNLCKLKVMTHNSMPIYSIEEVL